MCYFSWYCDETGKHNLKVVGILWFTAQEYSSSRSHESRSLGPWSLASTIRKQTAVNACVELTSIQSRALDQGMVSPTCEIFYHNPISLVDLSQVESHPVRSAIGQQSSPLDQPQCF